MNATIKNLELFLQEKNTHVITVINPANGKALETNVGMQYITEKHENIVKYFIYIKTNYAIDVVLVQKRRANGSSKLNYQGPLLLKLTVKNTSSEVATATNGESVNSVNSPNVAYQKQVPMQHSYQPEVVQQNPQAMGLNAYQIAEGLNNKLRVEMLEKEIKKLENTIEEYKADKKTDRKTIDTLVIDLREAKSDLATAQKDKDLAVREEKLNKQPAVDPAIITAAIEKFPELIGFISNRANGSSNVASGLGAIHENASQLKQAIVNFILQDNFTEQNAQILDLVVLGLTENLEYAKDLVQLNTKYNIN